MCGLTDLSGQIYWCIYILYWYVYIVYIGMYWYILVYIGIYWYIYWWAQQHVWPNRLVGQMGWFGARRIWSPADTLRTRYRHQLMLGWYSWLCIWWYSHAMLGLGMVLYGMLGMNLGHCWSLGGSGRMAQGQSPLQQHRSPCICTAVANNSYKKEN